MIDGPGAFAGAVLALLVFSKLLQPALARFLGSRWRWASVPAAPAVVFLLSTWGAFLTAGPYRAMTMGSLAGTFIFAVWAEFAPATGFSRRVAWAIGPILLIYAAAGTEVALIHVRSEGESECRHAVWAETGLEFDPAALQELCGCVEAEELGPSCRSVALLWSDAPAVECLRRNREEAQATLEGRLASLGRRDECLQRLWPASEADRFASAFGRRLGDQMARSIAGRQGVRELPQGVRQRYAECIPAAALTRCPERASASLQRCLAEAEKDLALWSACAAQTGLR